MYTHTHYYAHDVVSRYLQFQMTLCHRKALDLRLKQTSNMTTIGYVVWLH